MIQRTVPTPIAIRIAISLRQEVNVIIKVIFVVHELLVWDATRIGPIAELGGPGKADLRFDMGSGRFVPTADGAALRIQRAPKDESATRRASHEIDVAIALRVGSAARI